MAKPRNTTKTSKEKLYQSGESFKQAGKSLKDTIIAGANTIGNVIKGTYQAVDAGDKKIGEGIEKKMKEKGKDTTGKVKKFIRNNLLKTLLGVGILTYGGVEVSQQVKERHEDKEELLFKNEIGNSVETMLIPTTEFDLLNGKTITTKAPLTRWYLGGNLKNEGDLVIGDTLTLNSANSLHNLWTKKIEKYGQSTRDISQLDKMNISNMSQDQIEEFRKKYPIDATYLFIIKPYVDGKEVKNTMTLQEFINQTNKIVKNLKTDTELYDGGLTGNKKKLFDAIKNDISGECIVAYAMTELCENKENGEFNKQLFDLLLQNAGVNFLAKIPAIYDGKTSYGLYQFTEYALYDKDGEQRGASIVNKKLPEDKQITGSVIDLKSRQDQTKAAYMFALQNLNSAIKKLDDKQADDLLKYYNSHKDECITNITQLIAMCHHRPSDAIALKKWHEDNHKKDIHNYGNAKTYGKASKVNYLSLK